MAALRSFTAFFLVILFYSCSSTEKENAKDYIITEKDIIPEGLAFDPVSKTIYVSSMHKRKIVSINEQGVISDFIKQAQDDIKSVVGMEVDNERNCIWAVSCEVNDMLPLVDPSSEQWVSSVYQLDLVSGKLIKKYKLNKQGVFLNDLTVADDGTVYVSESVGKSVYKIIPGVDTLEFFINFPEVSFINGLDFTDKPGRLFVCNEKGVFMIDIASKTYSTLPSGKINSSDIDGLAFHKNYFIAHQSTAITRLYLSDNRDSIIRVDTLDYGKEFDASTTGEVSDDYYYYIVNAQVQSGIDFPNKKLKPMDSLENVIIRRKRL